MRARVGSALVTLCRVVAGGSRVTPLCFALALALGPLPLARADFVRDEVRVNLRTGPGSEYRIVKLLRSGDEIRRVERRGDWLRVRTPAGEEGWVPSGYVSADRPASVALPQVEARLRSSESRVQELEQQIESQSAELSELSDLRERTETLERENMRLTVSTRWKDYLAGGIVALIGMGIGAILARSSRTRTRRLKL